MGDYIRKKDAALANFTSIVFGFRFVSGHVRLCNLITWHNKSGFQSKKRKKKQNPKTSTSDLFGSKFCLVRKYYKSANIEHNSTGTFNFMYHSTSQVF